MIAIVSNAYLWYMIQDNTLCELANEFGTPLYVYEKEKIEEKVSKLQGAFKKMNARFFYACKSLSNINILKIVAQSGIGLDTVSINEVKLGLKAGFEPSHILFTPNCVAFNEIRAAKELGVHINIDNISILEQFGNEFGDTYPVMIRLNPHIMAGGNYKISTGHIDSKFGISIHQMRHIERVVKTTNIKVEGLHMHTGSEIKDVGVFMRGLEVMLEAAEHFPNIEYLDLGSGFKVPYRDDELETDVVELADSLKVRVDEWQKEKGKEIEIWFEPGKFIVSECGHFIVQTNVIKQTPATVFAGVNSGFNHLIRPMFYDSYHKIENISRPKGTKRIYTVVGNLCETDTFAWDRVIAEIDEGDYLVFRNAGAYAFEMASRFNSRLLPAEVLVSKGKGQLIRKRDEFDNLLANQIEL